MDHVPAVPLLRGSDSEMRASIDRALTHLVDEALKRALWSQQRAVLATYGFDWLPANAPEPLTLAHELNRAGRRPTSDRRFLVLHPDPPLGTAESAAIDDVLSGSGQSGLVEILTPRTFASRGGRVLT